MQSAYTRVLGKTKTRSIQKLCCSLLAAIYNAYKKTGLHQVKGLDSFRIQHNVSKFRYNSFTCSVRIEQQEYKKRKWTTSPTLPETQHIRFLIKSLQNIEMSHEQCKFSSGPCLAASFCSIGARTEIEGHVTNVSEFSSRPPWRIDLLCCSGVLPARAGPSECGTARWGSFRSDKRKVELQSQSDLPELACHLISFLLQC